MENEILLEEILPLNELQKQGNVLLIRHSHVNSKEMIKNNIIEEYQSFQSKRAFRDFKYIVSFVASERNSALFYGIYEFIERCEGEKVPEYSEILSVLHQKEKKENEFYIKLKRIELYDKYRDRIVIDWNVQRGWYNRFGYVESKHVVKLYPKNFVQEFPGLMNIELCFDDLKKIIENPESHHIWFESLSKLQAIYLILDKSKGRQYIGTTYGENGLWQRWESYVKGDHTGGNKELEELKKENTDFYNFFQFTILEVLSKTATKQYCTDKESSWKRRLGTRAFGLNRN
ncbi:MAG: GIY-YIG nuclease family protein [Bacteroidales bacterium]|nr:GIY-YIG nuclease family protein [Bacteroidales bacterium]